MAHSNADTKKLVTPFIKGKIGSFAARNDDKNMKSDVKGVVEDDRLIAIHNTNYAVVQALYDPAGDPEFIEPHRAKIEKGANITIEDRVYTKGIGKLHFLDDEDDDIRSFREYRFLPKRTAYLVFFITKT